MTKHFRHALPFGAEPTDRGATRFRLWAPSVEAVSLEIDGQSPLPMQRQENGWFAAQAPCGPGTHYRFRLPDGLAVPDPGLPPAGR